MPDPQQSVTLTKSVIDVADCSIAKRYFSGDTDEPLPFSSAAKYDALYQTLAEKKTKYADLRKQEGVVLDKLGAAFSSNKFWQRYLRFGPRSYDERRLAKTAWEQLVPVLATWKRRLEVIVPAGMNVQVRPEPRVLLYPFGWSTWINFLIDGNHSFDELAVLTTHLIKGPAYRLEGEPDALTLEDVFGIVGKGVSEDAFDDNTCVAQDALTVTTVLGKYSGGPSLGAPDRYETALRRLIRDNSAAPLTNFSLPLREGDKNIDFILHHRFSWFLWAEHRLKPFGRNAQSLRCYHTNVVRSLLQVWLLHEFFKEATAIEPWSAATTDLVKRALRWIEQPNYKNLGMLAFLKNEEFQISRAEAEKRVKPPKG
jgi:hypothetical protein